jgi:glycosyltransferase involved in cell wall biosynthesis
MKGISPTSRDSKGRPTTLFKYKIMKKRDISISIFFPTYNEEDNIVATVRKAEDVVQTITDTYEIIIVNDGSSDKTPEIAERLARENLRVKVIHQYPNKGYGAAVWAGIQSARYDWIFFTDADLQFKLEEMQKLVDFIPEYRVVLGYRAPRRDPFIRLINAKGWNILNRLLFGLKVRDIDCAFKLFDRRLVASLPIKTRGATMSAELLIRLQRKGVMFKEVPVTHLPRVQGIATGAKPAVILRAFKELFRLYRGELGPSTVTYIQIFKFGMIGVINTAIDVVSYFLLTRNAIFFSGHLVTTKILTFLLGSLFSFVMNRRFTFASRGKVSAGEVARFYSTVGMSVAINAGVLYFLHNTFSMYDLAAVAIATVIAFIWNFILSKFWVFKKPSHHGALKAVA